jgi:hypothetical protein
MHFCKIYHDNILTFCIMFYLVTAMLKSLQQPNQ